MKVSAKDKNVAKILNESFLRKLHILSCSGNAPLFMENLLAKAILKREMYRSVKELGSLFLQFVSRIIFLLLSISHNLQASYV